MSKLTIYNLDAVEAWKYIPEKSAHLIVITPPLWSVHNHLLPKTEFSQGISKPIYDCVIKSMCALLFECLDPNGKMLLQATDTELVLIHPSKKKNLFIVDRIEDHPYPTISVESASQIIKSLTKPHNQIVELFAGTAPFSQAASKSNRSYIAIDNRTGNTPPTNIKYCYK